MSPPRHIPFFTVMAQEEIYKQAQTCILQDFSIKKINKTSKELLMKKQEMTDQTIEFPFLKTCTQCTS